jgi:Flp pilus assembly protein TadD
MMQQVLVAHPNSAKAHFVQAELSARQGNLARAQEELTTAEKLAPGLPFAKPESGAATAQSIEGKNKHRGHRIPLKPEFKQPRCCLG